MAMSFSLESGVYFVDKAFLVSAREERHKERLARNILYSLLLYINDVNILQFCWTKTSLAKNFLALPDLVNAPC